MEWPDVVLSIFEMLNSRFWPVFILISVYLIFKLIFSFVNDSMDNDFKYVAKESTDKNPLER